MGLKAKIKIGDTIKGYEYYGIQVKEVVGEVTGIERSNTNEIVGYRIKTKKDREAIVKYSYGIIEFISKGKWRI